MWATIRASLAARVNRSPGRPIVDDALPGMEPIAADEVRSIERTSCCVVGGGPGGMMLALLLARRGVPVTLLEAHPDFDRQFRGDTLHPAILEVLDQIGLAEKLLELPHAKWFAPTFLAADGPFTPIDLRRLKTRFSFIMLVPQERFLDFLAAEARQYPHFHLIMGATVERLVEEGGSVRGVRYRAADGWHEVRAALTVGADGRFSRLRHLSGLRADTLSPPVELLWFRLPRLPGDAQEFDTRAAALRAEPLAVIEGEHGTAAGFVRWAQGRILLVFNRVDHWQVGYFYPAGHHAELRAAGLDALRASIVSLEPRLKRHAETLTDWHQLSPLSVAFSRCRRWYKPGLLLIGDAAHVMTPAAGAGIKYAIEDAVVAANVLARPLAAGRITVRDLLAVQRRREWPVRFIQAAGALAQSTLLPRALRFSPEGPRRLRIPRLLRLLFRLPLVRTLPARLVGIGLWRVRVK
jgi:2-polyprenyl-6-methoxyphenol hydroxylase-like FAD-dependent oxidoreductase